MYYISCKLIFYCCLIVNRLCGFPPFYDEDHTALFEKIKKGIYEFNSPSWDNISKEAKEIIKGLLLVDPKKRMTPEQLMECPWINGGITTGKGENVLGKMREWNSKIKLNPLQQQQ